MPLLEPKEVTIKTLKGDDRGYILSKFPAIAGREIIAGYPLTGIPKIGEYKANEEIMLKLMSYVAVQNGDNMLALTTRALVDNHVPDYETLVKLEMRMMEYNTSFFGKGEVFGFFGTIVQKGLASISPTLIPLLAQLSEVVKRRSKS